MKLLTLATALLLASCASHNPTSNNADPYVTIAPTNSYGAQYRVAFKNYENDDINIHSQTIRHDLLKDSIDTEYCPDGHNIKHEEIVKEGLLTNSGRQSNYYIYVRCD